MTQDAEFTEEEKAWDGFNERHLKFWSVERWCAWEVSCFEALCSETIAGFKMVWADPFLMQFLAARLQTALSAAEVIWAVTTMAMTGSWNLSTQYLLGLGYEQADASLARPAWHLAMVLGSALSPCVIRSENRESNRLSRQESQLSGRVLPGLADDGCRLWHLRHRRPRPAVCHDLLLGWYHSAWRSWCGYPDTQLQCDHQHTCEQQGREPEPVLQYLSVL